MANQRWGVRGGGDLAALRSSGLIHGKNVGSSGFVPSNGKPLKRGVCVCAAWLQPGEQKEPENRVCASVVVLEVQTGGTGDDRAQDGVPSVLRVVGASGRGTDRRAIPAPGDRHHLGGRGYTGE